MSKTFRDRTLALAGVFQSAQLVQQIARNGMADVELLETQLGSLFVYDAERTEQVYGGVEGVRTGLQLVVQQLSSGRASERNVELTRYAIGMLHLGHKLVKNGEMLAYIGEGLQRIERQREHFGLTHNTIVGALADLYQETISTLTPRIMVSGEEGHLNNGDNANRVRAVLLAGIRSTVLWEQSGGGRLQLLLRRGRFLSSAQDLLQESTPTLH